VKLKPDRVSKTEGHTGNPRQASGGRKQATQEFADGDHVVYAGRDWKGAVSRRGKEWLAVTEGGKSLGYFADKALAVKAVIDCACPSREEGTPAMNAPYIALLSTRALSLTRLPARKREFPLRRHVLSSTPAAR
jgi:hypothetical protein